MSSFKVKLFNLDNYFTDTKVYYKEGTVNSYELTGSGAIVQEHSSHSSHGLTPSFAIRSSDNKMFKGMNDLYLKSMKNKGHDVSDKNLLDDLYKTIFNKAIKAKGAGKLDSMYDGYNTVKRGIRLIRTVSGSPHFCISDPVTFRPHKGQFGAWDIHVDTPWVDLTTHYGSTSYHINLDEFVKKRVVGGKFLQKFTKDKFGHHNILLIPVGVPGHSVCVIFESNMNDKKYNIRCYWADPNGPVDPAGGHFEVDCSMVKGLWKQACEKAGVKWMDHLLCNIQPQGGSALTYFHSGGFCGGFTVMLAFLISINSDIPLEKIREYLTFRINQWQTHASSKDKRSDVEKSKSNVQQLEKLFAWVEKNGKKWNMKINPAYAVPAPAKYDKDFPITIATLNDFKKGIRVFQENKITDQDKNSFIRTISRALDTDSHTADLAHFRSGMIDAMGDDTPLNWMECHILIFLEYIYEWYAMYEPFTLIDVPTAEKEGLVPKNAGHQKTKSSNSITGVKDKATLKAFTEKYNYRKEYLKKCGQEDFNQAAKEGLLYDVHPNTHIID
jgi:hypothetical protein